MIRFNPIHTYPKVFATLLQSVTFRRILCNWLYEVEAAIVRIHLKIVTIRTFYYKSILKHPVLFSSGFDNTKAAQASVQSPCSAVPELLEALFSL